MLDVVPRIERAQPAPGAGGVRLPSRSKKVVLFLPPYSGPPLGPPVGLLSLASPLQQAGYEVKIIDGKIVPDYLGAVEREITDAVCFGVSLLTGPMINDAVAASRLVKQRRPELPIVFGGWHPSLLPEQTLREPFVDAVVRHQGEITFLEVVKRLGAGKGLDLVAGCWFKRDGCIHRNPDRPVSPIDELPAPAYDLVDFDAYEEAGGRRQLPFATSVGCPYACKYCTDTVFYNRRFNAYSTERVVEEVTRLVRDYRIKQVSLLDSNFLVNTKRAVEIARGFAASGRRFSWTFQASTDLLCRLSDEEVRLLGKSGVSHIGFGTESGYLDPRTGSFRNTARREPMEDLGWLPMPEWGLVDVESYRGAWQRGARLFFVESSFEPRLPLPVQLVREADLRRHVPLSLASSGSRRDGVH